MSKKQNCEYLRHYIKGGHETLVDFDSDLAKAIKTKDFGEMSQAKVDMEAYKTLTMSRFLIIAEDLDSKRFLLPDDTPPGYKGGRFSFAYHFMTPASQDAFEMESFIREHEQGSLFEFIKELKEDYPEDRELLLVFQILLTIKKNSKLHTKKELVEKGLSPLNPTIKIKNRGDVVRKQCIEFNFPRKR